MAYGHLSNYGLAIFSNIDIQQSTDYKFRSGQVAHRGSVYRWWQRHQVEQLRAES